VVNTNSKSLWKFSLSNFVNHRRQDYATALREHQRSLIVKIDGLVLGPVSCQENFVIACNESVKKVNFHGFFYYSAGLRWDNEMSHQPHVSTAQNISSCESYYAENFEIDCISNVAGQHGWFPVLALFDVFFLVTNASRHTNACSKNNRPSTFRDAGLMLLCRHIGNDTTARRSGLSCNPSGNYVFATLVHRAPSQITGFALVTFNVVAKCTILAKVINVGVS
jgi:hypothetical protein